MGSGLGLGLGLGLGFVRGRGRVSWCIGPTAAKSSTTAASEQRRLNLPSKAEAVSFKPCT